ncbi:hypothetical protein MF271_23105 (plasmid) [Deinococcus sp. KNUC1210]|uniref:hypothetical protein n=1 Tax=Deinococcus sp. KNUC1210 TaxID=2917691 RepID=UPI001EEFF262|nr:hypothetical protein [Deinococcus sp. KNUC1210]ULH18349.1 hypothetical protein MF271_23105 [Deinococcus sp. KNUC1210]
MPDPTNLTPLELADLLQAAYAADHDLPGEHLTDPFFRHDLARLLDRNQALKLSVIADWLEDEDLEAIADDLLSWLDTDFLGQLKLLEVEEE